MSNNVRYNRVSTYVSCLLSHLQSKGLHLVSCLSADPSTWADRLGRCEVQDQGRLATLSFACRFRCTNYAPNLFSL